MVRKYNLMDLLIRSSLFQMKKTLLLTVISLIAFSFSYGQGIVRGKITDKNGETLIGVTIVLKSNRSIGVTTDLDGNYSLKLSDSTAQTLVVSYISYQTIEVTIHPVNNEVIIKDFVLVESSQSLVEVEVIAKSTKAKDYYMENMKKNSSNTLDYISAETMKKTGDPNVNAAIARVSGVATNNSGFITVRGIGDRYVLTTMNGMRIPTLDPITNNVRLDMFPAYLVDNVIITKTASPNLPGNWAGAYISVETKDYPDKLSITVEDYVGYNNQTTFKNILSSQHSSTDWLGYDNGLREHNPNGFVAPTLRIDHYQEMVQAGQGAYYKSLGITDWRDNDGTGTVGETYLKLGLVQLGLLPKAEFNDPVAIKKAETTFENQNGSYYTQAFNSINAGAVKTAQSFPSDWNTTKKVAPPNFSQNFSIGNQVQLFGRPLGFLAGFRYSSSTLYDPNSIANRVSDQSGYASSYRQQQVTTETRGWSALLNVAYKFNTNNSVTLMFMPNVTGVNNIRTNYDTVQLVHTIAQFYESRKQMIYQYKSEHYIPWKKIKIDLNASYTKGYSNAPDLRVLPYQIVPGSSSMVTIDPTNNSIDRYYRTISDNLFDSRLSAEMPIGNKTGLLRKLIVGGAYQNDRQRSDQYDYALGTGNPLYSPQGNSINDLFSVNNFTISDNRMTLVYADRDASTQSVNHTFGRSYIAAGFAMLDYSIVPRLRVSGGLRAEQAYIYTDIDRFDSLGYSARDPRRLVDQILVTPGKLDALSILPSANIIYKVKKSEEAPINLRVNYSKTIARPSIRELSDVSQYNYQYQAFILGNPDLKMAHINNYDLRLESYFKNGDNLSVSLFYKDFRDHIELVYSSYLSWQNVDKSTVKGIEFEGKKKIIKNLEFRANVTLVNSQEIFVRSTIDPTTSPRSYTPMDTVKRVMYGQAPYIINGILSYSADSIGLVLTLSYNVQGPRLVIAQNTSSIPDVYELARHLVDCRITKKLGKHFSVNLTVNNILNAPIRRAYKFVPNAYSPPDAPKGFFMAYDTYTYGTNYMLGFIYKL